MNKIDVRHGDCREVVKTLADCSIDSCVTDPPYSLVSIQKRFGKTGSAPARSEGATGVYKRASSGFMGQAWDTGDTVHDSAFWAEVLRVLKPGAHLLAFAGTRTYHRMACAIEDAGFEIRDQVGWLFGSGFPKSHDVSKAIDRAAGAKRDIVGPRLRPDGKPALDARGGDEGRSEGWDRPWRHDPEAVARNGMETAPATAAAKQWQGWGTALKPAWEPICLARKPLDGTVAENVLAHGTGALNIDGCRVNADGEIIEQSGVKEDLPRSAIHAGYDRPNATMFRTGKPVERAGPANAQGRWPANVILSMPKDQYLLRKDITPEQKTALYRWMSENA